MVKTRPPTDFTTLAEDAAASFARIGVVACAATVRGDHGADLWVIVDANAVEGIRAVVPTIGDLMKAHPREIADFMVLPRRGQALGAILPPRARTLFVRSAA